MFPTTTISGKQCAAARTLLGWSQDDLARNAQVARATIAGFEGNIRLEPSRNNLLAIIASLEAAGIEFIGEDLERGLGSGVRSRTLQLEYSKNLQDAGWDLILSVRYRGKPCSVTIPRAIIDDIDNLNDRTPKGKKQVVQDHFPQFLRAVEDSLKALDNVPQQLTLEHGAFPRGTF